MRNMPPGVRTKVYGEEYVSRSVTIRGLVAQTKTFTAAELRERPQTVAENFVVLCGSGKVKDQGRRLTGVLLRDLLDEAGVLLEEHESPNYTYVVATGRDEYHALFSWHELFNTAVGDGVLVVLEKDGEPLGSAEGELCLVSANDGRPGPRRIRYLSTVEVRRI